MRPKEIDDPDRPAWRNRVDALPQTVTAWTGNDTRLVEFGEDEVRSGGGHDALLASLRDEGILLVGDESVLRRGQTDK